MFLIIFHLYSAPSFGLIYGPSDGPRNSVSIHNNTAFSTPCSTAHRLYHRSLIAQKPFFISIKNCHQLYFGNIKSLTQQINPYKNIKLSYSKTPHNVYPFKCINI